MLKMLISPSMSIFHVFAGADEHLGLG